MKIDMKGLLKYVKENVVVGQGPLCGLDAFVTGITGTEKKLRMRDLCVEVDKDGRYELLDFQGSYYDFIDCTSGQTLEKMLRVNIKEIASGKI